MVLLFNIPSLYSSRIQKIFLETRRKSESLEMQPLNRQPTDNLGTTPSEATLEPWDKFSRTLIKEWAALRILSSLVLATIFSMFQISGLWGNQLMMVAALFSFAALIYGAVLTIYVNGWRDDAGLPMWAKGIREPFRIGFLWSIWILMALPAIWTIWGIIFFFLSVMIVWVSAQGGNDNSNAQNSAPFTLGELAQPTAPPSSAVAHPWFIPLFAVAMMYLILIMYTLWGLSRRHQSTDSSLIVV
ncbi:hypothetical protein BD779DRAFT_196516 [Infundibulicybe gibba]|nr:hypothetical protein BD779DRAFT_196516 [Infundibulicybe gibba]